MSGHIQFLFLNSAREWGGNEKWTYLACKALSEDHGVVLAYRDHKIGDRFDIEKYRLPFQWECDGLTLGKLVSIVWKHGIDVLIPTKRKDYVLAGIVSKICGSKNILRLGIVRELKHGYERLIYHHLADGIIVNAQGIRDTLLKNRFMQFQNIAVIYNGLDVETLDSVQFQPQTLQSFGFLVTTMGILNERKGFDHVLRAFAHFIHSAHVEDAGLIVIGDGPSRSSLEALAKRLGIQDRVVFTGFIENPYPYLRCSDVFISASKNEGISNALLEAMYLENAVIASTAGGTSEVVVHQKNGLLVHPDDVSGFGDGLVHLYENAVKRIEIARKARQHVVQMFSLDRMKKEIVRFAEGI